MEVRGLRFGISDLVAHDLAVQRPHLRVERPDLFVVGIAFQKVGQLLAGLALS